MNIADMGLEKAFPLAMEAACKVFDGRPSLKRLEFFEPQKIELLAGLDRSMDELKEGSVKREGLLALLLRFEESEFKDRTPEGVEYEFGFRDGLPVPLGKIKLRGYVDRFDRDKGDRERVHVDDYKSGAIPSLSLIKKGLSFQLPVYIRALKEARGWKKISAAFYSLRRNIILVSCPVSQAVSDHVENVRGLDISGVRLFDEYSNALMEILEKGWFHHSADGKTCNYCEFRYACHKDDRRMKHLLDREEGQFIYSGWKNLQKWKSVDLLQKEWKDILKSMQKALTLKTASARKRHAESVIKFRDEIKEKRDSLPFHDDYIDEMLGESAAFEKTLTADH